MHGRDPDLTKPPQRRQPIPHRLPPAITACLAALDAAPHDPDRIEPDLDRLRGAGILSAPLPRSVGGLGLGTEPGGAGGALSLLRRVGRRSLALGRLLEAHCNAAKLVAVFGTGAQLRGFADRAEAGCLFGLWVTDDPADPVRAQDGVLAGAKGICSGVGLAGAALVTAEVDGETRMLLLPMGVGERITPHGPTLSGMEAARHGRVALSGVAVPADAMLGGPGDYLRQPFFSAGAWRSAAVALGGLDALLRHMGAQLVARGRDADPHQLARMGQATIARETASLWMARCAGIAEGGTGHAPEAVVAYVNLARLAVERACLDAMQLAQRSLGLAAFVRANPVERLCRDLATYLRQPAPDEALIEAAAHVLRHGSP